MLKELNSPKEIKTRKKKGFGNFCVEKTMDIQCIKIDDKWYIDQLDNEILDVLMANMILTIEE